MSSKTTWWDACMYSYFATISSVLAWIYRKPCLLCLSCAQLLSLVLGVLHGQAVGRDVQAVPGLLNVCMAAVSRA